MIFRNWILENFPFIEDDFDALTDYELFCKVVGYMKKSLEKVAGFQETINEFTIKLDEFQHYFDNLDVTEEVNAKLDEMVEDGTMEELIAEYLQLQTTYTYNNVAELKLAENLQNGMFVRTSGYYNYNDGGGAFYKIRQALTTDVIDEMFIIALSDESLVAEFLPVNDSYNINQLGCKGNGTFDNTTKLQAIINKAETTGFTVLIPIGNYLITDTLYINDGIRIEGLGKHRLWQGTSKYPAIVGYLTDRPFIHISSNAGLYAWDYAHNRRVENVNISNLRLIGTYSGNFSITGIYANTYISKFENLEINGFLNDLAIAGSYETLFNNCQFTQSYQNIVSFDNNRTVIFNDCWANGGYHTSGSVITDPTYISLYTKNHLFNYCCFYSNLSLHYLNNLAVENSCYGIIARDSKIVGNIINIESISDYCVHCSLNLRPQDSYTDLDNVHFFNPLTAEYENCKMFYTSYHSRLNLKTVDALPVENVDDDGEMVNNSIARIYSYITGEKIIPLTLSDNITDAVIINKSHYTRTGFKIDFTFKDQTAWSGSTGSRLIGLPASTSFTNSDFVYFACPTTTADTIFNIRIRGDGNFTTSAGAWIGGGGVGAIVKIEYEYNIT